MALQIKRDRLVHSQRALAWQIDSLEMRSIKEPAAVSNLLFATCFALAGFVLTRKTVEPFHLGAIGDVFCLGLALLAPYGVERFLRRFSSRIIVAALMDITILLTAISTLIFFAEIRADVFSHQLNGDAAVVFDGEPSRLPEGRNDSQPVVGLLRWAMILAGLGFELGAGLSWHDFLQARRSANSGLLKQLQQKLEKTERHKIIHGGT